MSVRPTSISASHQSSEGLAACGWHLRISTSVGFSHSLCPRCSTRCWPSSMVSQLRGPAFRLYSTLPRTPGKSTWPQHIMPVIICCTTMSSRTAQDPADCLHMPTVGGGIYRFIHCFIQTDDHVLLQPHHYGSVRQMQEARRDQPHMQINTSTNRRFMSCWVSLVCVQLPTSRLKGARSLHHVFRKQACWQGLTIQDADELAHGSAEAHHTATSQSSSPY